ncbi:MAG: hypothetical protein R2746_01290 [Acidimicrobiales bacterium]
MVRAGAAPDDGQPDEWEILARLALIAQGMGATADPAVVDDLVVGALVSAAVADEHGPLHGRDPGEVLAALGERRGPDRLVDLLVRTGPYGDGLGARTEDVAPGVPPLSLDVLEANPHGIDLDRSSLVSRGAADAVGPGGASTTRRCWPTCPASRRPSSVRRPMPCWWVGGTCARTTPGCTTWRCW